MIYYCPLCRKDYLNEKDFNSHIRPNHALKIEAFLRAYLPKHDLYDKSEIKYKSTEQYLSSVFSNRNNLLSYFKYKKGNLGVLSETAKECIQLRAAAKNLKYAPDTVEARTSILPSPFLCQSYGLNYNAICKSIGLAARYDYSQVLEFCEDEIEIIQDTREQTPLRLNCKVTKSTLNFGDYTCKNRFGSIFLERKSLGDCCGSLSQGFERFCREFDRAADFGATVIVMVEEDIQNLLSINNLPQAKHIKAGPDFLCHRLREILHKYPFCQFLFVDGRKEAARVLEKIFKIENDIKTVDLQFYFDIKSL